MSCRHNSPYPIYTTLISATNIPGNAGFRPRIPAVVADLLSSSLKPGTPPGTLKSKIIQTMFRESEAQTEPYEVDVAEPVDRSLEILTLGWLSWNNGLPAGMREVVVIERARQKRAWEKALPKPGNAIAVEIRDMILAAIEINEWTYREVEMAAMGSLRMEIAERWLREEMSTRRECYARRASKYAASRMLEAMAKMEAAGKGFGRELRRLAYRERGIARRYYRWDVIRELGDRTSEFYGPQQRFGVHPRRGNEAMPSRFRLRDAFPGLDVLEVTDAEDEARARPAFDFEEKSKPRNPARTLCIHETRWTLGNLRILSELLSRYSKLNARKDRRDLRRRRHPPPTPPLPFHRTAVPEDANEEEEYQAALFLQKTIKGRAIQAVMFDGRVKCQELLDELKSTHALQSCWEEMKSQTMRNAYDLQRMEEMERLKDKRKREIVEGLEGKTVGETLDFLNKELLRLQDERLTHAYALVADRERHRREAEEAGRRQAEEQRRRELDEIYKQLMRVYQNSVDLVGEDNFRYAKEKHACLMARRQAEKLAKKIDQAAHAAHANPRKVFEEEIVADLVYNFALPETEKMMVRKRLHDRQRSLVASCHDEVYSAMENAAKGSRSPSGRLEPLPRPAKHRLPPLIPVKLLRLAAAELPSENSSAVSVRTDVADGGTRAGGRIAHRPSDAGDWSTGYSRQEVVID